MSIRYECDGCGSVLKIKDSLAGTSGKCPTCKKKFVVPEKDAAPSESDAEEKTEAQSSRASASSKSAAVSEKPDSESSDEFDLDAFLMDDSAPAAKASAGLSTPSPTSPKAPAGPLVDKQGRRAIVAPPPSPGSSAEIPIPGAAGSATAASANARELLTKTMGGMKGKAAVSGASKKPRFDFDVAGSLSQLRPYAIYIPLGILLIGLIYWGSNRMLGARLALPRLAPVSGTVTLDGKPLANVVVHLSPTNAQEGQSASGKPIRLRDSTGITNENGYFEVQYIDGVQGAPLGNTRVWLEVLNPADYKKIPGKYLSSASSDIRDVKEAGNDTRFNLELTSQ